MSTHPSSIDLEAFACGETIAAVAGHLGACRSCAMFVERLRGAAASGPSRAKAAEAVARAAKTDQGRSRRRWLVTASSVAVPLAAAAVLLLIVRTPSTRDIIAPAPVVSTAAPTARDPETRFKGGLQAAVIRERAGEQARFTASVEVRADDRIRVEVALDREQAILAGVLGDDDSWLELMPDGLRQAGTHFSEKSARIDTSPLAGTILVGAPEAVRRARGTKRFDDVNAIRVTWEAR